jgi:hypothetical protein
MTTSPSSAAASVSSSNGESFSSLPRWRQFLSTLNWRPVRGIELEIEQIKQRSRQNESEAEQRMKLIESEILRVRSDSEQIEERTKQIESETEQIKKETEQLRRENARLSQLNARQRALSVLIKQHCFPPESSSIPPQPTEPDCGPSSP